MSDHSDFPLNAEQIVRGLGFLAAQWFDRTRRPGDAEIGAGAMTLALGEAMGVPLPTEEVGRGDFDFPSYKRLLPYGVSSRLQPDRPKPLSDQLQTGGSDED